MGFYCFVCYQKDIELHLLRFLGVWSSIPNVHPVGCFRRHCTDDSDALCAPYEYLAKGAGKVRGWNNEGWRGIFSFLKQEALLEGQTSEFSSRVLNAMWLILFGPFLFDSSQLAGFPAFDGRDLMTLQFSSPEDVRALIVFTRNFDKCKSIRQQRQARLLILKISKLELPG